MNSLQCRRISPLADKADVLTLPPRCSDDDGRQQSNTDDLKCEIKKTVERLSGRYGTAATLCNRTNQSNRATTEKGKCQEAIGLFAGPTRSSELLPVAVRRQAEFQSLGCNFVTEFVGLENRTKGRLWAAAEGTGAATTMQAACRVAIAVLVGVHAVAAALPFCDTLRSVDQPSHSNTMIEKLGSHRGWRPPHPKFGMHA
jgi:hypothetical protein